MVFRSSFQNRHHAINSKYMTFILLGFHPPLKINFQGSQLKGTAPEKGYTLRVVYLTKPSLKIDFP